MARARLHLICGNSVVTKWNYCIDPKGQDNDGVLFPIVYLTCGNCSTVHDLENTAANSNPMQRLEAFS